ncbi:MAG: hypothetical protein V4683_03305 [Bacteroidota bacterium]
MLKLIFLICFVSINAFSQVSKQLDEIEASRYVGKYKLEVQKTVMEGEIRFNQPFLYFYTEGLPEFKLLEMPEKDQFKSEKYEVSILFIRNEFREVESAKIWFQGQEFIAKKMGY